MPCNDTMNTVRMKAEMENMLMAHTSGDYGWIIVSDITVSLHKELEMNDQAAVMC